MNEIKYTHVEVTSTRSKNYQSETVKLGFDIDENVLIPDLLVRQAQAKAHELAQARLDALFKR